MNNLRYFHSPPLNKELNMEIFQLQRPATNENICLCLENVLCTYYATATCCFWVFFNAMAKNGRASFFWGGGFWENPPLNLFEALIKNGYMSFMSDCLHDDPPCLIVCHDWINLHRICVYFGNNSTSKTVLNVTNSDVENQLSRIFLVRLGEMRKKWDLRNIYI